MGSGIATGERAVEGTAEVTRALGRLPHGWVTLHDLAWPGKPGFTIDHVVVGPSGVFVIAAESWTGTIEVVDQVLTQDGQSREQTVDLAARAAIAVQGLVPGRCFPVVCFAGAPLSAQARDVLICSSSTVQLKLLARPRRLSPEDVARCVEALEAAPGHRASTRRGFPLGGRRKDPQPKKPQRPVLVVVALLELFLAMGLVLGGSMQQAADWVTQSYVSVTDPDDQPDTKPVNRKRDDDQQRQGRQP